MQNRNNFTNVFNQFFPIIFFVKSKLSKAKKCKTTTISRDFQPQMNETILVIVISYHLFFFYEIFNYYFRFAIPVYHRQMSIPRKPFPTKLIQLSTPSMATLTHGGNLRLFLVDVNTTESPCPLIFNRYTY